MRIGNVNNDKTENVKSFLSFSLGHELFAIPTMKIVEILEVLKITKIPISPKFLVGVINLRGSVLPVIDTRIKFGMTPIEYTVSTCILVLNIQADSEEIIVRCLVDSVLDVFEMNEDRINPSPTIATQYRADYIQGMIKDKDTFIMLLNIDKIFSTNDLN